MKVVNSILASKVLVFFGINLSTINDREKKLDGQLKLKKLSTEEIEKSRCKQYEYVA